MHSDTIVTNTDGLVTMALAGQIADYNRQVDPIELQKMLCEKGIHMELFKMIHEHRNGKAVDPHYRLIWIIMTKEYRKNQTGVPPQITIDVPINVYDKYVTTSDKIKSGLIQTFMFCPLVKRHGQEDILDEKIMEALNDG